MLQLNDKPLPQEVASRLEGYQQEVDAMASFPEKVTTGKELFSRYNKSTNAAFKVVRQILAEMSGGTARCNYCEDSNANQIEHIYPKNFYPEKCFVWKNFGNFKARLFEYVHKKETGGNEEELIPLMESLKREHHQTVWHKMIRQRNLHPEIDDLLNRAPEALTWM